MITTVSLQILNEKSYSYWGTVVTQVRFAQLNFLKDEREKQICKQLESSLFLKKALASDFVGSYSAYLPYQDENTYWVKETVDFSRMFPYFFLLKYSVDTDMSIDAEGCQYQPDPEFEVGKILVKNGKAIVNLNKKISFK
jgi:hypothetical protein